MESSSDFEFRAPQYIDSLEGALEDYCEDSFFETESTSARVIKTARRRSFSSRADENWTASNCSGKLPVITFTKRRAMTPLQDRPVNPAVAQINLKRKASPMLNSPPAKYIARSESAYQFKNYVHKFYPTHNKPACSTSNNVAEKENEFHTKEEEVDVAVKEDESFPVKTEETTSELWNIISKEFTWTDKFQDNTQVPFKFLAKPGPEPCYENVEKSVMGRPVAVCKKAKSIDFNPENKLSNISFIDRRNSFLSLSVYERGKVMLDRKHEKISKILEEESSRELREFHANPMPPVCSPKISTSKIKSESSSRQVMREISNKELNTEKRAKERQIFNNYLKQKKAFLAAERQKAEEEREAIEKFIIASLRKNLVHKPLPLPPEHQKSQNS